MDNGLKIEIKIIYNAPKSKLKKIEKFEQAFQKSDQKYLLYLFSDIENIGNYLLACKI